MAKLSVVVLAFFFLGCAFAQVPTIMDLVPGATATPGSLLPTLTADAAEYPQNYYRLWVPENTQSLTLVFSQTDAVCTGDIRYNIHADHVPCGSKWTEGLDSTFPCREAITDYFTDTSSDTIDLYPGSYTNSALLKLGSWVYISMSRDVPSSDYAGLCTYTILTTLTTCATAGQVGVNTGSGTATCAAVADTTLPYVANWNTQLTESYMRVWIPERTAHVQVYVNNTDASTYFYGNANFPGGDYYYECYDSYTTNAQNVYEINTFCFNPPAGWFYIYFYTYSSGYYLLGNASITLKQCPENQAGYNCSYEAWNMTGAPALTGAQ
jgi:hypothetical protein